MQILYLALNFVISFKELQLLQLLTEFNSIMLYEDVSILLNIVEQSKSLILPTPQCSSHVLLEDNRN